MAVLQINALALEVVPDEVIDYLLDLGAYSQPCEALLSDQSPLAVLHPHSPLGEAALRCLQSLLMNRADTIKNIELDFPTLRRLLCGLGAREECLRLVASDDEIEVPETRYPITNAERENRLYRLLLLVLSFAQ